MPNPTAKHLLEQAKTGKRLTTKERRHVIVWLVATAGIDEDIVSMTNQQMGDLFGVTERTIRMDKQAFRKEKAKFIREDDVSLIIADIALDYERQIRDIEKSKAKAPVGTMTYLRHCTDALNLRVQMVKSLQDLGYYPKNLGQLTVTKWDFQSQVDSTTGYVVTDQVEAGKKFPMLEGRTVKPNKEELNAQNEISDTRTQYEFITETDGDYTSKIDTTSRTS